MKCNRMKILSISLMTVVSASLILSGCGAKKTVQTQEDIRNVKVAKADIASVVTNVEYPGKLDPVQQISVSPKVPGKVASVRADIGTYVKAGDLLFTLDNRDLQAQLRQQQASLELSKVNLAKTKGSALEQQLLTAEQAFQRAQTAYNDAKDNYDKMKQLYQADAISKQDMTNSETRYTSAQKDLDFAKSNYDLLKQKLGPESIDIASAQLHQAEAGIDSMSIQIDNSEIRSPISGIVSARNVDIGEMSSSAAPSFTIIDSSALIVKVEISDKMVGKVAKGMTIPVKVPALNKTVDGTIDSISPSSDDRTQLYSIKIKIDNSKNDLKAGMFARAVLPAESRDNVLVVPNSAVKTENNVQYVYIVSDGKVKKDAVETGLSNDKITEVRNELKKGDLVITEGQTFLNEGQKVTPIN